MEVSGSVLPDKSAETISIAKVREAFQTADVDGDGWISREEFAWLLGHLDPQTWGRSKIDLLFKAADTDCSGYLDAKELLDWILLGSMAGHSIVLGDSESDDDSSSSSSGTDGERDGFPEPACLPQEEYVARAISRASATVTAATAVKSEHEKRSIKRVIKHQEPLTTVEEMYELLTMRDGKVGSILVLEDMVTLFHESKIDGLGPRLSRLVPQMLPEVTGEPEDVSVLEVVHLYRLLRDNRETSAHEALSTIRAVKDECRAIDVSHRRCRHQEIKKLGVDMDASIGFGMFRRLLELLSIAMQINQANMLAIFAWVRTCRFEMTEEMGSAFMEDVFLKHARGDAAIWEQFVSDNDFVSMCHAMKLIDATERRGIAHGKLSMFFCNLLKHMPRLLLERATRRYTDRGKLKSRPRKRKHNHRRIVGLTQLSILMEELYKRIPLNRISFGSPALLVLQCLETCSSDWRGRLK